MLVIYPEGPKIKKIEISIENEIFERATHRGPIFCGEIETSRLKFSNEIKNFDRDQKFRSRSLGVLLPRPFVAKNPFGKLP